jgi:altronate dehydratase large subunit
MLKKFPIKKVFILWILPGQDIESITGMLAGGAQIVVFTTGRGTPTGSPIAPVIKVSSNTMLYKNMYEHIDVNAGEIINKGKTIEEIGQKIFNEIIKVCNGKLTKSEILGHQEFGIYRIGYTF